MTDIRTDRQTSSIVRSMYVRRAVNISASCDAEKFGSGLYVASAVIRERVIYVFGRKNVNTDKLVD